MTGLPAEEDQEALRLYVRRDPTLHGGGFTFRDGEWLIWLAVAKGEDTAQRPREFRGYRIAWEDSGPFYANRR
ncbi:hypothetical protein [Amycolatopsis sp. NPDC051102]|uniref:hypothetical protein n=1 Tax=Amycolatopsis sp. NPDC051102 TaxID=3155163 RepID=UPI00343EF454